MLRKSGGSWLWLLVAVAALGSVQGEGHEFLPSLFQQREYWVLTGGARAAATVRVLFLTPLLRGTCFRLTRAWFAVTLIHG